MALFNCPECGKEISDKAAACPHCGCPVSKQNENQLIGNEIADEAIYTNGEDILSDYGVTPKHNATGEVENINSVASLQTNVKKKRLKGWHKVLIGIASVVCVLVVLFVVFILIPAFRGVSAYNEISPYLDYVGNSHRDEDEAITLTEQEYNNIENVELLGMKGKVTFQLRDGYISSCTWTSSDFCSEDKYRAFADDLYVLFDSEPKTEDYSYGNGNTYRYYWTDSYYNLDVTMAHGFFAYDPDGKIEIKWEVPESFTVETDEEENTESNDVDSKIGVVENIHIVADIPNELMNEEFKSVIDLFSKGFSQSGLDITNVTTCDDGETYIFYLDNLEFLGDECEDGALQPRIIYNKDAINNNGTPNKVFFEIANPLKSNGYKETVEMVEDIAEALDISNSGLIDNDYSSSSKLAIGEYATFTFPNLSIELTVSNTDGTVEIEIVPID